MTIGGRECGMYDTAGNFLTTALAPQLPLSPQSDVICFVPDLEAGVYNVSLVVQPDGEAAPDANAGTTDSRSELFQYEQLSTVSSLSPPVVSVGGGAVITVVGTGFSNRPDATAVTVGGVPCPLTYYSTSVLKFTFPDFSRAVDLTASCPVADSGSNRTLPGAGIGSVLLGSRGARLQTWSDPSFSAAPDTASQPFTIPLASYVPLRQCVSQTCTRARVVVMAVVAHFPWLPLVQVSHVARRRHCAGRHGRH